MAKLHLALIKVGTYHICVFDRIRHFKQSEFDSPDVVGSGVNMDFEFLVRLDGLRGLMGIPFKINSGFRTLEHNRKIGGATGSPHRKGMAADISTRGWTEQNRWRILEYAKEMGFTGIGISPTYIHLDTMKRNGLAQTAWRYALDGTRPKVALDDLTDWA